jgi:hypothetical protein
MICNGTRLGSEESLFVYSAEAQRENKTEKILGSLPCPALGNT